MRRIVAALIGVVLAVLGALLVVNYAHTADARAAADLKTEPIVVALEKISPGTPVSELGDAVEVRHIPAVAAVADPVSDLTEVEGLTLAVEALPGEQLTRSRFATEEDLRARGETSLPEELADRHQVTVRLEKERALGGDIAPGDTVGVFMSFDVEKGDDGETGTNQPTEDSEEPEKGSPIAAGGNQVSVTELRLHKVPVVRVEGAFVAPAVQEGESADDDQAEDRIFVTLALEPDDAAKLVFAAEWGSIWLSLEPEGAPDDRVATVVITLPERGQAVLQ